MVMSGILSLWKATLHPLLGPADFPLFLISQNLVTCPSLEITGNGDRDSIIIVDLWFLKNGPQDDSGKLVQIQVPGI